MGGVELDCWTIGSKKVKIFLYLFNSKFGNFVMKYVKRFLIFNNLDLSYNIFLYHNENSFYFLSRKSLFLKVRY
jgi:hypothetical protein